MRVRLLALAVPMVAAACAGPPATSGPNLGPGSTPRPREVRVDTDAWTQAMQNDLGSEIYIRNKGNVPLIVTSVTLTSCVNIRDVCGTSHPRTRINPGDARRVMRVRYQNEALTPSFRYTYRVEPADPTQG